MIPVDFITEWRGTAPWVEDYLVEQDLVITRSLVEIFTDPLLCSQLAFRGGTAIHKLFLRPAIRFSEDIDLVQVVPARIGPVFDAIRARLDHILGSPDRETSYQTAILTYRFMSEDQPPVPLRLKIEINTRQHLNLLGPAKAQLDVDTRWFSGSARIPTFDLDELLGTKLRTLYQRRKGRDLFDIAHALRTATVNADRIVDAFTYYVQHQGLRITRSAFITNLEEKLENPVFTADMTPLLRMGATWDPAGDTELVVDTLVSRLP